MYTVAFWIYRKAAHAGASKARAAAVGDDPDFEARNARARATASHEPQPSSRPPRRLMHLGSSHKASTKCKCMM